MHNNKQAKLVKNGWQIGSVSDFLKLTTDEAAYIELKLARSQRVREFRSAKKHASLARLDPKVPKDPYSS